jgi:hypothetical protein
MKLSHLTDKTLLSETQQLAQQYRSVTTKLLHHLREIDDRKLYSDRGYGSLFNYVVQELGFSESSASRRIAAMRLLRDIPELEEKIESGDLTLTHLGKAAIAFRKEQVTDLGFKKEVLACIENTSTKTCEKALAEIVSPQSFKTPRGHDYEDLPLSHEAVRRLETLRGLLAHHKLSTDELVIKIFDLAIDGVRRKKFKTSSTLAPIESAGRYVPAGLRKAVFERDQCCQKCGSDYALELDHVVALSLGGKTNLENLRLLCRNCNQRARISAKLPGAKGRRPAGDLRPEFSEAPDTVEEQRGRRPEVPEGVELENARGRAQDVGLVEDEEAERDEEDYEASLQVPGMEQGQAALARNVADGEGEDRDADRHPGPLVGDRIHREHEEPVIGDHGDEDLRRRPPQRAQEIHEREEAQDENNRGEVEGEAQASETHVAEVTRDAQEQAGTGPHLKFEAPDPDGSE